MFLTDIKNRIRDSLHQILVQAVHATSAQPLEIKVAPVPFDWPAHRDVLLEGTDLNLNRDGTENKSKRAAMETLLDNTYRQLSGSGLGLSPEVREQNLQRDLKVILPIARQIVPNLAAWDLVGVQPLSAPVGQVFFLQPGYNQDDPSKLSIQILKEVVEAKSKKLRARYAMLAAQDAEISTKLPGIHLEDEVFNVIAKEIGADMDVELIGYLRGLASKITLTAQVNTVQSGLFDESSASTLAVVINRAANVIAERTRRGAGNWCVVSPTVWVILKSSSGSSFVEAPAEIQDNQSGTIHYVGMLNNSIRVYLNPYASDKDPVIVGYKGSSQYDCGVQYCPYIPVLSSGVLIDPATFEPCVSFITRYGMWSASSSEQAVGQSSDYFALVELSDKTNAEPVDKSGEVANSDALPKEFAKTSPGKKAAPAKKAVKVKSSAEVETVTIESAVKPVRPSRSKKVSLPVASPASAPVPAKRKKAPKAQ